MPLLGSPAHAKTCGRCLKVSLLPDIFIPHLRITSDVIGQHSYALPRPQINNFNVVLPQPPDPSGKVLRLTHDYRADLELTD